MSETATIVFYQELTEIARYEAEVDPAKYVEWCESIEHNPAELSSLQAYLMDGQAEYEYKDSVDITAADFRDFEFADYAKDLTAMAGVATTMRTDAELHEIAIEEVARYGKHGRPWHEVASGHSLTEVERGRVVSLMHAAKVTVTL